MSAPLLEARGLRKHFPVRSGLLLRTHGWVRAVDDVSLAVQPGETLGVVGESGCGKSTLARLLLRLIEPDAGTILFAGEYVHTATPSRMKRLRRDMQFVFQDPYASLNPRLTIEDAVAFNLLVHGTPRAESRERAGALLGRVGLDPGCTGAAIRTSCRAASASASISPAHWCSTRSWSCSTSPSPRSTSRCRPRS